MILDGVPTVWLVGDTNEFEITQPVSTNLGVGVSTTFVIKYIPTNEGTDTATVYITNNVVTNTPYTFDIQGTVLVTGTPTVDNTNGASLIDGAAGTAYLNGTLGGATADVRIYYGTTDGATTPGNWDTSVVLTNTAVGNFSNQVTSLTADQAYYYRCYATNASGYHWASNSSIWLAQTRTKGGWHLVSVPVDFGAGQNTLNGALGTNLAMGLYGSNSWEGDMLWYQENTNWTGYWLATNDVWRNDADTNLATRTLGPGAAFWIKRRTNGGAATAYTTFAGDKPTTSTQLVFALSNWTVFGWPFDETTQDSDSWGFAITGATKALGSEYADRIRAEYGGVWYSLYLYTNGNWCTAGTRNKANIMLQPGKGYYYYRRGTNDLIWSAPAP